MVLGAPKASTGLIFGLPPGSRPRRRPRLSRRDDGSDVTDEASVSVAAERFQVEALPARHTDFIFCVCGEELGMIGCLAVIALLAAIIIRVLLVARAGLETPFHCYVCVGVAAMLIFQTVVNIGMCLFVMPVIGLTLPFFSYGGSSLLTLYAAMGVVSGIKSDPLWSAVRAGPWGERKDLQTRPECARAVFFCIFAGGRKKLAVHPPIQEA